MGLIHIWGDDNGACNGTDLISDTPNQGDASVNLPTFPKVDNCSSSFPGVMFMNYMDYTDDAGMNMFTNGQKERMRANFYSGGYRENSEYAVGVAVQGLTQFCSSFQNYTISNLPIGATVSWSINPSSGVASLSTSGNTATLTQTGNGTVTLNASVNTSCGLVSLTPLTIHLGNLPDDAASINIDFNDPNSLQCGNIYTARAIIDPSYTSSVLGYQWSSLTSGWNIVGSNTVKAVNFATPGGVSSTGYLELQVENSCGWTSYYIGMTSSCGGGGFGFKMAYYPNPANTSLTVQYLETDSTTNNSEVVLKEKQVMLLNEKGIIIRNQKLNHTDKKVILDIRDIPNGTYYLHVKDGKEMIKQQIIIKHE